MKSARSCPKGFTLVELLVVLAIISLLAALVIPNVVGKMRTARMTRAEADLRSIETAIGSYLTKSDGDLDVLFGKNLFVTECLGGGAFTQAQLLNCETAWRTYRDNVLFRILHGDPYPGLALTRGTWPGQVLEKSGELTRGMPIDPWNRPYYMIYYPRLADRGDPRGPDESNSVLTIYLRTEKEREKNFNNLTPDERVPSELEIYLFSLGQKKDPEVTGTIGVGDDITNWDNARGWKKFYE